MDFYQSGAGLIAGTPPSGQTGPSPSVVFDNRYAPFAATEDVNGRGSSGSYSGRYSASYVPQTVGQSAASHSSEGGYASPTLHHLYPSANAPSSINHPYLSASHPFSANNSSSSNHSASMNHSPSPMNYGPSSMHYGPSLMHHNGSISPPLRPPVRGSSSMDYSPSINHGPLNHGPSSLNHGGSPSPPPPPPVPPNSPVVDPLLSSRQPTFSPALPFEIRRPGRPRGGRLSAIEQYYRAAAQFQYAPRRAVPHLSTMGFPTLGGPGLQPAAPFGEPLHHRGGSADARTSGHIAPLHPDPSGSLQPVPAVPQSGQHGDGNDPLDTSEDSRGGAPRIIYPIEHAPGSQHGELELEGGGHRAHHRTSSDATTTIGSCAPAQGIKPSTLDTGSIRSQPSSYLRRQPASPQVAPPPQPGCQPYQSYQSSGLPQLAGPSPFGVPPQFATSSESNQFTFPGHLAHPASVHPHPSAQYAQAPMQYGQAQQRNIAPQSAQLTQYGQTQPAQLAPAAPPPLVHDLPASIVEKPQFQRILRMTTDPRQLPPNITPEQTRLLQQTQVHLASQKFDKVREANNKSAKRGRYKRMATTVALADEIMRQEAETKRLREENVSLNHKLAHGVVDGTQHTAFDQHNPYTTGGTASYVDEASQSFTSSYESSHSNALGIILPSMSDLFGSPDQPGPSTATSSQSNSFNLSLSTTTTDTTADTSVVTSAVTSPQPAETTQEQDSRSPDSDHDADADGKPDEDTLELDPQFLREAQDMRRQLIDAVKGGKIHELGFGCHEEIEAVILRGRRIRESLGQSDDDWDRWTLPIATTLGRRKRSAAAAAATAAAADEEEGEGEEAEQQPARKKGRKSKV